MSVFIVSIECDNEAFDPRPNREIARILRDIADKVSQGNSDGVAMDANGNKIGSYSLEP